MSSEGVSVVARRRSDRSPRPAIRGKFLWAGEEKLYVKGVTYGALRQDDQGREYQDLQQIDRDFALMASQGLNAVRIPHTMPPVHLLDIAARHGLRVMVGLSAEQYLGFWLDRRKSLHDIGELLVEKVGPCVGHPALLCYALGNEITASLARWTGRRRIEQYLGHLYRAVKRADPDGLVTYVNYPSTEYLDLHFLDLVSFNVYLESRPRLGAYLSRLQNLAGDRPLMITELGLDSLRNGQGAQATSLDWQIRTTFAAGCAGAFVFAWTDEWNRGGAEVDDWMFGITTRDREPKPALAAVRTAFAETPFPSSTAWPRISVVVCSRNGGRFIRQCLEGVRALRYPDFEAIVVDDGSTDNTAAIASEYDVRLLSTGGRGLSYARNVGIAAATGDIVAFVDDDAWPDPDWLTYLAATFTTTTHAAVGGPNLPPPGDGLVAQAVAHAPGGPIHVLISDTVAEHIPGCNFAGRKACLDAVGGFDAQFWTAGDDVDLCWRLQEKGWTLGYSPAAVVWHRRRDSVRAYWRQQRGYGKAEAMLERKWPEKYNSLGHATWNGRIYSTGGPRISVRSRIYQGMWGTAPFQSAQAPDPTALDALMSLPATPEWYLAVAALSLLSVGALMWPPLAAALPFFLAALVLPLGLNLLAVSRLPLHRVAARRREWAALWFVTALLHVLQPIARLTGRLGEGLTIWRWRAGLGWTLPWPRTMSLWTERSIDPIVRLQRLETWLRERGHRVSCGGDYDRWDLQVRAGVLGAARLILASEDHGSGRQLCRVRCWPYYRKLGRALVAGAAAGALVAAVSDIKVVAAMFGVIAAGAAGRMWYECAGALAALESAIDRRNDGAAELVLDTPRQRLIRKLSLRPTPARVMSLAPRQRPLDDRAAISASDATVGPRA